MRGTGGWLEILGRDVGWFDDGGLVTGRCFEKVDMESSLFSLGVQVHEEVGEAEVKF